MLGFNDIKARYRGSIIGPWWITIALAVTVGGVAVLYSGLFKTDLSIYAPHIAVTLTVWGMIQAALGEATAVFLVASNVIKQTALPKSGHIIRMLVRNLLIFAHNFIVAVAVLIIFRVNVFPWVILALPGLLLVVLNLAWMSLIIASLSVRFKDVPQIVNNGLVFITIMTPVYWMPTQLGKNAWVTGINPFYYLLEIVRQPLLGHLPAAPVWPTVLIMTVLGWIVAVLSYAPMRGKIVHWI
jgi:ABC-type polysaccharide/polyol phosphate export permease